jgi:hypothetical protein
MNAPNLCPLLMQGLMATMIEEARPSAIRETVSDERMTACIGSRCAKWHTRGAVGGPGACGLGGPSDDFPDPAWSKP